MQMGDISSPTYPVHSELELFLDQSVFGVNVPLKRTAKGYSKMPFPKIHMDYIYIANRGKLAFFLYFSPIFHK